MSTTLPPPHDDDYELEYDLGDLDAPLSYDPTLPLTPTGNLRRRMVVNRIAEGGATLASAATIVVLAIVIYAVVQRGGSMISWAFITKSPPQFGGAGGGIAPALIGTMLIVAMATVMATPIAILIAIYLTEYSGGRIGAVMRLALDMLNSLPSIVVGVFVFGLLVTGHHQSGFAGSVALAIIMVPLIARSTQEMLLLVPPSMREAADALGVARWRSVLRVILPSALGGILTGVVLAVARAAGETAPLLLLDSIYNPAKVSWNPFEAIPNIPVTIFTASEAADPAGFKVAWGAAFILLAFILLTNIAAKALHARSRKKLS